MSDPFDLNDRRAYEAWREHKLARYPVSIEALTVEIRDPLKLAADERATLLRCCGKTNFAFYKTDRGDDPDKAIPQAIAKQLGLLRLDHNLLADEDGLTTLSVASSGMRRDYIPYTNHALKWHTDGYYNQPEERITAFQLHCVRPAASGGENALLDHEIAYLRLRDENPQYIAALMQDDAMTIPARTDDNGVARPAQSGPVFSKNPDGSLHMRYTARKRSIEWKNTPSTLAAVRFLEELLATPSPFVFRSRLAAGMGLICNNVLHDRTAFADSDTQTRLIYRARFYDRIPKTFSGLGTATA